MAQTYTLEQSAERLGIPLEEFKRRWKTEWTTVRTFRDGGTVRFRSADIDELARTLGMASDPGLQLAPPAAGKDKSSTEFLLPDDSALDDDIFTAGPSDSAKKRATGGKKPADSDIRLEADAGPKSARRASKEHTPTEELSIDLSAPSSGSLKKGAGASSAKLTAPKSGPNISKPSSKRLNKPKAEEDSSSEFELNLDSDSDSFELTINPDGSDEIDLGGSKASKAKSNLSGINLARPADSGVSLEDDSDSDEELSLDPPKTSASGRKLTGSKSAKMNKEDASDSDSEFELTLDDNSGLTDSLAADAEKGDIFETDFELPANVEDEAESGSEVVAVESADTDLENSDFDLALDESDIQAEDESASQVVLLDDEPAAGAGGKSGKMRKRRPADEDEAIDLEDDDASSALRNVPKRRLVDEDEDDVAPAKAYKAAPWGALPAAVLLPCFILTFLGGLMSYELLKGMWAYNSGTKPAGSLVRGVAGMFDMDPESPGK